MESTLNTPFYLASACVYGHTLHAQAHALKCMPAQEGRPPRTSTTIEKKSMRCACAVEMTTAHAHSRHGLPRQNFFKIINV